MALADRIVVMNKGEAEQIGPPFETYEWPATPFVAEFLGKTNVLDATGDAARGEGRSAAWLDSCTVRVHRPRIQLPEDHQPR